MEGIDLMRKDHMQHTIAKTVKIKDIGLHSGVEVMLSLKPAKADTGIVFHRTDVKLSESMIRVTPQSVVDTKLCTVVANEYGHKVMTIEHLMAAFSSQGIDNVIVEISAAEVPAMDGSSYEFISHISRVGTKMLNAPRKMVRILKPVIVEDEGRVASFKPSSQISFEFQIEFLSKSIGKQSFSMEMENDNFDKEISAARTFGFKHEIEQLRQMGLARGGSLENAILIDGDRIMNAEPLRYENEFVRHKMLDAVGDIYVCGMHIMGAYFGSKSGHEMNNKLLRALFSDSSQYEIIPMPEHISFKKQYKRDHHSSIKYQPSMAMAVNI